MAATKAAPIVEIDIIGSTAGEVWSYLAEHGKVGLKTLYKNLKTDVSEQELCMALGWLAREGKVDFERRGKACMVYLK